jgi:hypothetical protein
MCRRSLVYPALGLAVAVPRLVVLLYEGNAILASFAEKSDAFATTFVDTGTYGFAPGVPSASTQPLYGFVLVPLYAVAGRSWQSVGLYQIALAIVTVWLVYELGRRFVTPRAGAIAALLVALNPYLVWHDVHVNREIVDGLVAAALVLVTLGAAETRSLRWSGLAGALAGVAILGNARLVALPLLLAAFLVWRLEPGRKAALAATAVVAVAALVVTPWVVRNRIQLGCFAITTDSRALWKANNVHTDEVLAAGGWIDQVPPLPGAPALTPEFTGDIWRNERRIVRVDECGQMRLYTDAVLDFWRDHPGEKAELAARGAWMLWDPRVTTTEGGPGAGTRLDTARLWIGGLFFSPLFLLALAGLRRVPIPLGALAAAILGYQTLVAMAFVGATRYRAPWDFLLALLAAAALAGLVAHRRRGTEA